MNKKSPYRFVALTMAFLMFFTSAGFSIDVHYCQGKMKSVSFMGKAKNCHESMKQCPGHAKMLAKTGQVNSSKDNGCCANEAFQIQSDQDQNTSSFDVEMTGQIQQFVTAFVAAFLTDIPFETAITPAFAHYKPPPLLKDIPVLVQSFLI